MGSGESITDFHVGTRHLFLSLTHATIIRTELPAVSEMAPTFVLCIYANWTLKITCVPQHQTCSQDLTRWTSTSTSSVHNLKKWCGGLDKCWEMPELWSSCQNGRHAGSGTSPRDRCMLQAARPDGELSPKPFDLGYRSRELSFPYGFQHYFFGSVFSHCALISPF